DGEAFRERPLRLPGNVLLAFRSVVHTKCPGEAPQGTALEATAETIISTGIQINSKVGRACRACLCFIRVSRAPEHRPAFPGDLDFICSEDLPSLSQDFLIYQHIRPFFYDLLRCIRVDINTRMGQRTGRVSRLDLRFD